MLSGKAEIHVKSVPAATLRGQKPAKLSSMNRSAFAGAAKGLGVSLNADQLDAFTAFETALYESNKVMNLTRVPQEDAWIRHFLDSLLLVPLIPEGAKVLDLGTGPGLPAWPLACARPDIKMVGVDSNGKMLGFLRTQPLPNLDVVQVRVEEWPMRNEFDVVTGRAFAPVTIQLEASASLCKVGGIVILMRTPGDEDAIQEFNPKALGLALTKERLCPLPGTDAIRLFPIYTKFGLTPQIYPRRWAEMKSKPLR